MLLLRQKCTQLVTGVSCMRVNSNNVTIKRDTKLIAVNLSLCYI